jgi:hypothetical protein
MEDNFKILQTLGIMIVASGKYGGARLDDLDWAQLQHVYRYGAGTAEQKPLAKAFAKAKLALRTAATFGDADAGAGEGGAPAPVPFGNDVTNDVNGGRPRREVFKRNASPEAAHDAPAPCAIVPYVRGKNKKPEVKTVSLVYWICSCWNVPAWCGIIWLPFWIQYVVMWMVLAVIYPPVMAIPAHLIGGILRLIVYRIKDAWQIFLTTLMDSLGALGDELWTWFDKNVVPLTFFGYGNGTTFSSIGTEAYPVGKALSYLLIGSALSSVLCLARLPAPG